MAVVKMYSGGAGMVKNNFPKSVTVHVESLLHDRAVVGIGRPQVGGLAGRGVLRGRHIRVRVDGCRVPTAVALPWPDRTVVGVGE